MEKIKFKNPLDAQVELEEVRLGNIKKGLGIGVDGWDDFISFKKGQFNMINGHDNVGKTDVMLWYFVCLAKIHNLKFCLYSSENTLRSQVFKLFNFWTGKRLDKNFIHDDRGYQKTLCELSENFVFIPNNKRYNHKEILDCADKKNFDALLIDPFNSLMTETANKHQEDYDICADIRIFSEQNSCTTFVNAHLVTSAARSVYGKESQYEGHLKPPEKSETEGGQKFANRADDFYTVHRMTQHPDRWKIAEVHVRKVKETITGGGMTPRSSPIELHWSDYAMYFINGVNPLANYYTGVGKNELDLAMEEMHKTKEHSAMSRMSYGSMLESDDLPF